MHVSVTRRFHNFEKTISIDEEMLLYTYQTALSGRRLSKPSLNFYCRAKIDVLIEQQTSRAHRCDTPTVTSRKVVLLLPSAREISMDPCGLAKVGEGPYL